MDDFDLPFRQIHLDFHTSEFIDAIGSQFDPEEFAATLAKARVNSITCFARCHHGWIYYDSKLNPEQRHPHLAINLLKAQIDACHAHNIRVPIYTSVQWDRYTASQMVLRSSSCDLWISITSAMMTLGTCWRM